MLRITVDDQLGPRTFTFTSDEVTIGRAKERDLVLDEDGVSRLHAKVTVDRERGEVRVEDKSENGTWLRGKRVRRGRAIGPDDWLTIGDTPVRIRFEDFELPATVTAEAAFLEALKLDPRDDATRAVYADWLDEHGKRAHAEFLRTQVAARGKDATDPQFSSASTRLAELAKGIDLAWRARVAMVVVQACGEQAAGPPVAFELECTRRWDDMLPTATEGVRTCTACKKNVVYCTSLDQAQGCAEEGGCVALDVAVSRTGGELVSVRNAVRGRPLPNVASRGSTRA